MPNSGSLTIKSTAHLEARTCCVRADLRSSSGAIRPVDDQRRRDVLLAAVGQDQAHLDQRRCPVVAQRQHHRIAAAITVELWPIEAEVLVIPTSG